MPKKVEKCCNRKGRLEKERTAWRSVAKKINLQDSNISGGEIKMDVESASKKVKKRK